MPMEFYGKTTGDDDYYARNEGVGFCTYTAYMTDTIDYASADTCQGIYLLAED